MKKSHTVIINGRLIDMEKATIEELEKLEKELKEKENSIRAQIDQLLDEDE